MNGICKMGIWFPSESSTDLEFIPELAVFALAGAYSADYDNIVLEEGQWFLKVYNMGDNESCVCSPIGYLGREVVFLQFHFSTQVFRINFTPGPPL